MALEMRDHCEKCRAGLPHDAEAHIGSYECTFCVACSGALGATCPTCGGEQPVRLTPP